MGRNRGDRGTLLTDSGILCSCWLSTVQTWCRAFNLMREPRYCELAGSEYSVVGVRAQLPGRAYPARPKPNSASGFIGCAQVHFRRWEAVTAQKEERVSWLARHAGARAVEIIPNAICRRLNQTSTDMVPFDIMKEGQKLLLGVGRFVQEKRW